MCSRLQVLIIIIIIIIIVIIIITIIIIIIIIIYSIIIKILLISINTQLIIQNRALSLTCYLGLSADNHLDGKNGCQ